MRSLMTHIATFGSPVHIALGAVATAPAATIKSATPIGSAGAS